MAKSIDHRRPRRASWLLLTAAMLGGCSALATPAAGTQAAVSAAPAEITVITLSRGCFGCAGSVLVLQRDGSASFTITGNARQATIDKTSKAIVPAGEFDRLAEFVSSRGFFTLKESYEDPAIRDGPWTSTGVARAGQEKQVFRRDDAGPDALKEVEAAIDALKARLTFVP